MSTKLLAVSGGIDSMVMLDFVARGRATRKFLVVTVDHGTRESSAADAEFVARVAQGYGLKCEVVRLQLGEGVSEAEARAARYAAIEEVGRRKTGGELGKDFEIWTAQHLDDLMESVAINILRGTGWRGLAAMDRPGVFRPFLEMPDAPVDKRRVRIYAAEHGVVYRQDPTNTGDNYLRNRVRPLLADAGMGTKAGIFEFWGWQKELKEDIDEVLARVPRSLTRSWLKSLDEKCLDEILRAFLLKRGISTTRPQRKNLAEAIRNYENGKFFNLPGDKLLKIDKEIKFPAGRGRGSSLFRGRK